MEGYLWKQRYYERSLPKSNSNLRRKTSAAVTKQPTHNSLNDPQCSGNPRRRYVTIDIDNEALTFRASKEDDHIHKTLPFDQISEVLEYGDDGFLIKMRYVATVEKSGAMFLLETEPDTDRDEWIKMLQPRCDSGASGLHLVVKNEQSIHERYDCMFKSRNAILGTGMSGDVRRIRRKYDGKFFALKTVSLSNSSATKLGNLRRELDILKSLDHPHINRLQETFIEPKLCCRLVLEICEGGELFERLHKKKHFSEVYVSRLVKTMLKALNYLHEMNVVHRDLKLENWLFRNAEDPEASEDDADICMIDFGLSRRYRSEDEVMRKQVGTCYYVSPEVLKGSYSGNTCDMWALGVITYMLISGRAPFEHPQDEKIHEMILTNEMPDIEVSDVGKDFLEKLLTKDPKARMTTAGALKHPWILSAGDHNTKECSRMLRSHTFNETVIDRLRNFAKYKELKRLTMEVIAFSLGHSEIKDLTSMFEDIDRDNDGYITFDEFLKALLYKSENKLNEQEIREIFNALDEENNGRVHVNEFVAGALQVKYTQEEHHLAEAFARMDIGGKGKITVKDLRNLLGKTATEERIKSIWESSELCGKSEHDEISFRDFLVFMRTDGENDVEAYRKDTVDEPDLLLADDPMHGLPAGHMRLNTQRVGLGVNAVNHHPTERKIVKKNHLVFQKHHLELPSLTTKGKKKDTASRISRNNTDVSNGSGSGKAVAKKTKSTMLGSLFKTLSRNTRKGSNDVQVSDTE